MALMGMEMLFKATKSQINTREDALVVCLHWNMVANGFRSIGIGENIPSGPMAVDKSELLPDGWNNNAEVYNILYQTENSTDTFLLKALKVEETVLVNLLRLKDEKALSMPVLTAQYVTEDLSSYKKAYRNLVELKNQFKRDLVDEFSGRRPSQGTLSQEPTGSRPEPEGADPLRVPSRRPHRQAPPEWADPGDPFSVGRADLDPLAGGRGGGMLMDPFRGSIPGAGPDPDAGLPGRLPRGAVPPGARFDPFGVPDPDSRINPRGGHRAGPDPDHLPPPGFDDMFM